MKSNPPVYVPPTTELSVLGYPVNLRGAAYVPKTFQAVQTLIAWRNRAADAPDYWLRVLICLAFERMIARRMQDAPAADLIEVVAEDWVEIIGEGMSEELDRDRVIVGFKLIFRECRRWPQPAELLKRLPRRNVPAGNQVKTPEPDAEAHARGSEALAEILEKIR